MPRHIVPFPGECQFFKALERAPPGRPISTTCKKDISTDKAISDEDARYTLNASYMFSISKKSYGKLASVGLYLCLLQTGRENGLKKSL